MTEEPLYCRYGHEVYIQTDETDASSNPENLCCSTSRFVQLAGLDQRRDEHCISCNSLAARIHTVLKLKLYRFQPLPAKIIQYFNRTVFEDFR